MSCKFGFGTHLKSTCTFEHLHINIAAYYLNNLSHQSVSACQNVTNLILRYRSVDDEGHHVGYYATNSSFCCHISLICLLSEFCGNLYFVLQFVNDLTEQWSIHYGSLTFQLKPFSFKHTGLFPEQAVNWDWFSDKIRSAKRPVKVLNLFAYTGGATLAAAAAGASVTHVDASKGMVTWAKENAASSGLSDAPIRWIVDDCVKFVEREIRRGNHYDAIIMDPPSYGRGPKGEIWKIEESVYPLIKLCAQLLTDKPLFFLVNSYTTGLQPAVLRYMIATALEKYDGTVTADEIGLPVSSNGLVLPCGASGRFEGK